MLSRIRLPPTLARLLPVVLLTLASACATEWHTRPLPAAPGPISGRVRITLVSGEHVELTRVQLGTDSLYGERPNDGSRVAVAVADVAYAEGPQVNASGATILTVVAVLAWFRWYLLPRMFAT